MDLLTRIIFVRLPANNIHVSVWIPAPSSDPNSGQFRHLYFLLMFFGFSGNAAEVDLEKKRIFIDVHPCETANKQTNQQDKNLYR